MSKGPMTQSVGAGFIFYCFDVSKLCFTLSYNNRNPALGILWSWHRVASPSIETDLQICSLSGKFDLWSYHPMDHKVTQTHFLSIPTFLVSFEDACVKKIILFKWGLKFESTGLPSWLLNLAVTWPVLFFWENYPYIIPQAWDFPLKGVGTS